MIINLTPHPVVVLRDDAEGAVTGFTGTGPSAKEGRFSVVAEFPPTGTVARARQQDVKVGELTLADDFGKKYGIEMISTVFGEPTDLPEPTGTAYWYVVSVITAQAAKASGRSTEDLLITSDPVRDDKGRFIGVRKFAQI